jgi:hypothetical protein
VKIYLVMSLLMLLVQMHRLGAVGRGYPAVLLMDKALAQNKFQSGTALGKGGMVKMPWGLWVPSKLKELRMLKMMRLD